jgi:Zn-dependent M28 family amino/carboxypeptidase
MKDQSRSIGAYVLALTMLALSVPSWATARPAPKDDIEIAMESIRPETLRAHVKYLSDDLLEGRGPGTRGAELAAKYIATQFEAYGLEPPVDGTYFQNVPIVNVKADPATAMSVEGGAAKETFKYGEEFTAQSGEGVPQVDIEGADIVFAGYGIVAPEYQWDDYKGADVKGKILLMLVNEPTTDDPKLFAGNALTYYGRWTYKYEEAARHGARGVILVHTTESATYPWLVVQSSNTGIRSELVRDANSPPVVQLKSWVTYDAAFRIAKLGGHDLPTLEKRARERSFTPSPLGAKLRINLKSSVATLNSPNVVGLLPGSDPKLKDEYVVFSAHYDHLGVRERNPGDKIYNGALDNASGVAAVLSIAETMAHMKTRPRRSVLFMTVTAEEQGLLGAQYYAERPIFPLLKTAANVNLDETNVWGRTRDFVPLGAERSSLGPLIEKLAKRQGLTMKPDQFPEKGAFFRSDHFCFAKVGVPCLTLNFGVDVEGKPEGWGRKKFEEYNKTDYHQPSDTVKDDWDFRGTRQHAQFALLIGATVANEDAMPEWNAGEAFQAARDAMKKSR